MIETAKNLGYIPKDLQYFSKFNILKSSVLELIKLRKTQTKENSRCISFDDRLNENDKVLKKLELVEDKNGKAAFPELLVNVMMEYAYRQGVKDSKEKFENETINMKKLIDNIITNLDDGGYLPEESK